MGKVIIEIDTDNAAFEDKSGELGRLFNDLATLAFSGEFDNETQRGIRDINGNKVGQIRIDEKA